MASSRLPADAWLRASLALLAAHVVFIVIVQSRPGLAAVILWYVTPALLVTAAASLLVIALVRSWRFREVPTGRQLAGYAALLVVVGSLAAFRTYPSAYDDAPSGVRFRLPLDGPVTVAWGGRAVAENYHAVMPDQRWAYDLLVTKDGLSFQGDGARLEDYYAYGREVLASAGGVVRTVEDGQPDGPIGQRRFRRAFGNHVVLEVAPGEFLFIAHLQPGSIPVTPGDRVSAGDVIGRVGNSGNSSEPHVHLHLQDRATPSLGEAIPFHFHDYRSEGTHILQGIPHGGRERGRRVQAGAFTGDIVEHVAR